MICNQNVCYIFLYYSFRMNILIYIAYTIVYYVTEFVNDNSIFFTIPNYFDVNTDISNYISIPLVYIMHPIYRSC